MLERGRDLGLEQEALSKAPVLGKLRGEQLERDVPLQPQVVRSVDDAHPAAAEQLLDPVAEDFAADARIIGSRPSVSARAVECRLGHDQTGLRAWGVGLRSFTHVALRVEHLREAEAFYCELFALEVAFREVETREGWWTVPAGAEWAEIEGAGVEVGLVMLFRDGFRLALEAVGHVSRDGLLSHVGVHADEQELARLRDCAPAAGCEIVLDGERALIIDDPFGVRWELNTFAYDDPPSLGTGARTGAWLELEPPD
jgi:catechol 2,3-dioxygenase-like lactoylglutathione lyase family enzyme